MHVEVTYYVERDGEELELTIHVDAVLGCDPYFGGHPDNWEPGSSADANIEAIMLDGKLWNGSLTLQEKREVEEKAVYQLEDDLQAAADDAAEYSAEKYLDMDY